MVTFKDHLTGEILITAENGEFEYVEDLFFKFRANYIMVKKKSMEELQQVVDVIHNGKMKIFDMWRVEKDIFDFGEKLGELVETKMYGDDADFTYMVDYIFNLRAWFRANRETKDMLVYMGNCSTYMSHAYVRNFTPVFVRDEGGVPYIYIFKETVHTDGLIEDMLKGLKISEKEEKKTEKEEKKEEEKEEEKKEEETKANPVHPAATMTASAEPTTAQ